MPLHNSVGEYEALEQVYKDVLADHARIVRMIDVLINGEAGAAKQASLIDLVGHIQRLVEDAEAFRYLCHTAPILSWFTPTITTADYVDGKYQGTHTLLTGSNAERVVKKVMKDHGFPRK